jgi:plasmid stabilization system protein ParE
MRLRELERAPGQPRLYYRGFRRVLLRRFPYKVFYQVIDSDIVIFRVLHAKQDHGSGLS